MAYVNQDDLKTKVAKLHREGEERAAERLAQKLGLSYVDLEKTPISLEAVKTLPEGQARDAKAAVIQFAAGTPPKLALALVNPELPATKKIIEDLKRDHDVKVVVVSTS